MATTTLIKSLILLVTCIDICHMQNNPTVISNLGTFIGVSKTLNIKGNNRIVNRFVGIPYAKPPVGDFRFKKPQPADVLSNPFNATEYGAACLQVNFPGVPVPDMKTNEDCLFINIFVPSQRAETGHTGHAVMVNIHGGGFIVESGNMYVSNTLAAFGNVIVVNFNYRLGIYGFLSTGDVQAPGNMGLWDQQLALQWVKTNIAAFGGDSDRITIFGESAGAISVFYQGLYAPNKGLFHRVIAQSGTPNMIGMISHDPLSATKLFAANVNCDGDTSEEIVSCLRQKRHEDIDAAFQVLMTSLDSVLTLGIPVVDNDFIKFTGSDLTNKANEGKVAEVDFFRSLDLINGFNIFEGGASLEMISGASDTETWMPSEDDMNTEIVPTALMIAFSHPVPEVVTKMVISEYTDWKNPNNPEYIRNQFLKLHGDLGFAVPAVDFSRLHSNRSADNVSGYMYQFLPRPSTTVLPTPSWVKGANHGDELGFVFGFDADMRQEMAAQDWPTPEQWEYDLSDIMMTYWTNFAKTGDPNRLEPVPVSWQEYTLQTQKYIEFDKQMTDDSMKEYMYARESDFWLNLVPSVIKADHHECSSAFSHNQKDACDADGNCG